MRTLLAMLLVFPSALSAQDRTVEPTWLHRDLSAAKEHATDLTTSVCRYVPLFGEGDSESRYPISVVRFGQLTVAPGGECQPVTYPRQEEIYFVRDGGGTLHFADQTRALAANDFAYLRPCSAALHLKHL